LEDKSISEEGTPFTIPPLDKINWQANSIEAREILNGSIPTTFLSDNPYVNKVLKYMADRPNLPEIDTYIMKEQVAQGFKRRQTKETPSANSETDSQRAHGIQTIRAIHETDRQLQKQQKELSAFYAIMTYEALDVIRTVSHCPL
jgi:hypothetical protein